MDSSSLSHSQYVGMYPYSPNLITVRACENDWGPNVCPTTPIMTSQPENCLGNSHDQSTIEAEDTFGLEFAAVQWLNLVTNAEQLFNKLLNSIVLTGDEKEQIQRWLYLKQECEECVASDDATSLGEHQRQSLERIDELTERTGDSTNSLEKSSDSQYESETESDFDSNHPDFEDKLDGYMERFKDKTDELIRSKLVLAESVGLPIALEMQLPFTSTSNQYLQGRRKSLHPGSIPPLFVEGSVPRIDTDASFQSSYGSQAKRPIDYQQECSKSLEPYKELKLLSTCNDAKKTEINKVVVDMEEACKRIEELQHTIQIKEQFIREMIKNSDTRSSAKVKFQRKWSKLEEEYYKTRTQLAHAENELLKIKHIGTHDAFIVHKNEVEKYKSLARHYEKRLKDIDMIKQIAGDSAKKVLELENSLQYSKKQMEKLKRQLRREEGHKQKLEQELMEDQQKMKNLEEKYNLQMSTLLGNEKKNGGKGEGDRLKWIAEETERLNVMRESSQRLHKQLVEQQSALNKRETFLKEKLGMESQRTNILEANARMSQLDSMLREKNKCDVNDDVDDRDQLRQEIYNLRKTRENLLEQRSTLDEKYHKERRLSLTEERHYLECAEAIEAIDAAIEYKNELICGRSRLSTEMEATPQQEEPLLMARLLMLKFSPDELRTLLYKYFQKVIDLRESGRRMEEQLDEAEHSAKVQEWRAQELDHALQGERLEGERRLVALQREHQEKVHLMLRHFAEESGSSGTEALLLSCDNDAKLKRENNRLRRRLQEMEALMQAAAAGHGMMRLRSRSTSPDHRPLKQLPAPAATTKVTREKNKMIIRVSPTKKKSTKNMVSFHHHK